MRVVVTGGAGFLGSHLCEALLGRGHRVVCVDNLSTGRLRNVEHLVSGDRFTFVEADISVAIPVDGPVAAIAHLASPASPPDYHRMPLETLRVGSRGTENALELARCNGARFVLASTSEVYGDAEQHPQVEDYWGNVNPVGPRSVYDEAKRFSEAITMAYRRRHDLDVGIVRIFNTYGPRMRATDGRVVSSFIAQAFNRQPLTIYGDGTQSRSLCYVDDLIRGLVAMVHSDVTGPLNLGNPVECTILDLAREVLSLTGSCSPVEFHPLPTDDPVRRRPDIRRAADALGWWPQVDQAAGLRRTIDYFGSRRGEVNLAGGSIAGPQYQGWDMIDLTAARQDVASGSG